MHTSSVCVYRRVGRVGRSVVVGLGFGWWASTEAVHEAVVVVPVHPGRGDLFEVGQGGEWSVSEWGVLADAFGFVQPDGGFGKGVGVS